MAGFVIPALLSDKTSFYKSPTLTLNVITENLAMTLGTTLSETLSSGQTNNSVQVRFQLTLPPLPRPDISDWELLVGE